jgi:hypothetical protein
LTLSFVLLPFIALAQPAASFEDVSRTVEPNQRVAVKDIGGDTTRGSVIRVTPSSITVSTGGDGTRSFERETVSEIRRSDRLWNGLLIGLGAGFLATEIWVHRLCGPRGEDEECAALVSGVGWLTFVPGGAVVGALVDKGLGNQLIYQSRGGAVVRVSPSIHRSRVGVSAHISF